MSLANIPFIKLDAGDVPRPWLPISIINTKENKRLRILGLIDTGADECALPAFYAELLGHNLQQGKPRTINTGNAMTTSYSHTVTIELDDITIKDVLIDFMPNLYVPLLGVRSFLSNFILTVDYPALKFSLDKK